MTDASIKAGLEVQELQIQANHVNQSLIDIRTSLLAIQKEKQAEEEKLRIKENELESARKQLKLLKTDQPSGQSAHQNLEILRKTKDESFAAGKRLRKDLAISQKLEFLAEKQLEAFTNKWKKSYFFRVRKCLNYPRGVTIAITAWLQ